MGKIKNNVVTKGFSGAFGDDLIFRQLDNQTIFAKRTLIKSAATQSQLDVRNKFADATQFASAAMDDPQASVEYKLMAEMQGLKSAYVAAVADCLTDPEIGKIYTLSYKGAAGDTFSIKPKVLYKVIAIQVTIMSPANIVLESGAAAANQLKWRYTAQVANAQVKGSTIILVASDRQGKQTTFKQVL